MSDESTQALDEAITAAVTKEQETDAMRLLLQMPDVDPVKLTHLARDVAQNFYSLADILKKHELTVPQYEFLKSNNRFFAAILADQIKAWQGLQGTEERLKLMTLLALEEQLPTIAGRMGRQTEELRDVVEAAKLFAKISGVDAGEKRQGSVGERFQITIDLGSDVKEITINPPVIDITPEKE